MYTFQDLVPVGVFECGLKISFPEIAKRLWVNNEISKGKGIF